VLNRDQFHQRLQELLDCFGVGYRMDHLAGFIDAHWPTMMVDQDAEWWAEEFRQGLPGNRPRP
jgi:hypothetical protein